MHRYKSIFFSQDLNRLIRSPISRRKDSSTKRLKRLRANKILFSNFNG